MIFDPPFPCSSIYLFNTRQRTRNKIKSATLSDILIQFQKYAPKSAQRDRQYENIPL